MGDLGGGSALWAFAVWLGVMGMWLLIHWARRARRLVTFGTSDGDVPKRTADMDKKANDERRRVKIDL
jgi:hypothetical protein